MTKTKLQEITEKIFLHSCYKVLNQNNITAMGQKNYFLPNSIIV